MVVIWLDKSPQVFVPSMFPIKENIKSSLPGQIEVFFYSQPLHTSKTKITAEKFCNCVSTPKHFQIILKFKGRVLPNTSF